MFDGDQLHQFIASSRANSLPLPSFPPPPLHGNPSFSSAPFDPNFSLLHLHQPPPKNHHPPPWSNDEVLALLKLRSSMEIWFPDFTWDHVSGKLTELGFKRGPEECKEKFEDESRHFNSVKMFSELDELYHHHHQQQQDEEARFNAEKVIEVDQEKEREEEVVLKTRKKRKRKDKFEMFKGFCEDVVKKMIDQQEEMHNKMIEDILKREKEKMEREESWKNEEMIRVGKEMEMRSKEQASALERQGTIIEYLKKFTCDNLDHHNNNNNNHDQEFQTLKKEIGNLVNKKDQVIINSSNQPENPSCPIPIPAPQGSEVALVEGSGSDIGKRWPRDEVLALINLRCKMSGNTSEDSEGGGKGPLWERISQGMMELGYKRNAKRCKEKWENINKYFRKTKDSNKKRSVNSRTCPYFHHLTSLYTQGTLLPPAVGPNNNIVHQYHQ